MAMRLWPAAVLVTLLSASPLAAQATSIEFVPYVGALIPTNDLAKATFVDASQNSVSVAIRQKVAVQLGGRLVAWWSNTVGWEGTFAYAIGTAEAKVEGGGTDGDLCERPDAKCDANVWYASSKLLLRYAPQPYKGWQLFGGAGLGVAGHVGDFWEEGQALTDLGVVLNGGASYDLSRIFAIRLDVEDYIYPFKARLEDDPEVGTTDISTQWQNDLVISAGLVLRFFGI